MLFSVIIPAYNTENYIIECLDSITSQDFNKENFEIIVIDDASPDKLSQRVKEYSIIHPNVTLIISPENKHQGGARNIGLKRAKGEYIFFVDSDDIWIRNDVFKIFEKIIIGNHHKFDIIKSYKYQSFNSIKNILKNNSGYLRLDEMTGEKYLSSHIYFPHIWTGIYRKDFLLKNNLFFREHVFYEDTDWTIKVFCKTESVAIINYNFLGYRYNLNSTTTVRVIQTFDDNISSAIEIYEFINKNDFNDDLRSTLNNLLINIIATFLKITRDYKIKESIKIIRKLKHAHVINYAIKDSKGVKYLNLFFLNYFTFLSINIIKFLTISKRFMIKHLTFIKFTKIL